MEFSDPKMSNNDNDYKILMANLSEDEYFLDSSEVANPTWLLLFPMILDPSVKM